MTKKRRLRLKAAKHWITLYLGKNSGRLCATFWSRFTLKRYGGCIKPLNDSQAKIVRYLEIPESAFVWNAI